MTIKEAAERLLEQDDFLILTHQRPDGDTIGSGAGLCYALRRAGKTAFLYNNPQFSDSYDWAAEPYIEAEGYEPKYVVAVDLADDKLFPKGFEGKVDLCIDHHLSNTFYAKETLLIDRSSCGEVVLELSKELCELDSVLADLLYIAVSTDTGCFVYGNTNADTHRAAAQLFDAGAKTQHLNKYLFRTSSRARLALEGMIFSSLRYHHEDKTVVSIVTKKMMEEAGAEEKDCQDIASLPGRVEGAHTSIFIKESGEDLCKVSLRTNGIVNASNICALFGGGGHAMAAGCVIKKSCLEAEVLLIEAIGKEYE